MVDYGMTENQPQMMTDAQCAEWWGKLLPSTQEALKRNPYSYVPPELVPELVNAGISLSGAYWVETQEGIDGFNLSAPLAAYVESAE